MTAKTAAVPAVAWCGQCRKGTRHREDPETGADLGRCATCHPGRVPGPLTGAERAIAGADPFWLDSAQRALDELIRRGHSFCADDLDDLGVPRPDVGNRVGALFLRAARAGRVVRVGYQQSRRPEAAGRVITVWRAAG